LTLLKAYLISYLGSFLDYLVWGILSMSFKYLFLSFLFLINLFFLQAQISNEQLKFVCENELSLENKQKLNKIFFGMDIVNALKEKVLAFCDGNKDFQSSILKEELKKFVILKCKNVHETLQVICKHSDFSGFILKMCIARGVQPINNVRNVSRVVGANLINEFIYKKNYRHVIVPKKYLYHLTFLDKDLNDGNYIVVAQEINILSDGHSESLLVQMDKDALKELREIVKVFGYKDFSFDNIRITSDTGKIVIIDTEQFKGFNIDNTTKWNDSPFLQKIDGWIGSLKLNMYLNSDTKTDIKSESKHISIPKPNAAKVAAKIFLPGFIV